MSSDKDGHGSNPWPNWNPCKSGEVLSYPKRILFLRFTEFLKLWLYKRRGDLPSVKSHSKRRIRRKKKMIPRSTAAPFFRMVSILTRIPGHWGRCNVEAQPQGGSVTSHSCSSASRGGHKPVFPQVNPELWSLSLGREWPKKEGGRSTESSSQQHGVEETRQRSQALTGQGPRELCYSEKILNLDWDDVFKT